MKICFVGPGIISIPPKGWGAVEIVIWDLKETLEKKGYEIFILNTKNINDILDQINIINPDFIHIEYDCFIDVVNNLDKNKVVITSHYGYLEQMDRYKADGFDVIFNKFISSNVHIFAISQEICNVFIKASCDPKKIHFIPTAVRTDLFKYNKDCIYPNRSIYLGKIENRKRQYLFQEISSLYFVGNIIDNRFIQKEKYLGEWTKSYVYENLTNYANLVLLSDGEAAPSVTLEALASGLGIVVSEYSGANLDLSKPFISVIPENMINDIDYVEKIIDNNRKQSILMRDEIRKYAIENFDYENVINKYYIPEMNKVLSYANIVD